MVAWWQVVVTIVCILLSGTFSGLTLGLLSLDLIDLRVLTESGTENERWYATRILPVRRHGNWLLCTLLIGNTAVNSALAIVTADLFGGIAGFLTSTVAILYIGEIIPQAVCHRFGLIIGAYAIPFVKLFMFITAPISFTTAKAIDFFLGGESVTRYNKSQLKSLLSMHGGQAPDPEHESSPDADSDDPNDRSGDYETDSVRVTQRHQDNITIVELPQILSHNSPSNIDAYTPSADPPPNAVRFASSTADASVSAASPDIAPGQSAVTSESKSVHPTPECYPASSTPSPMPHDRGKARVGPLSKWHGFKRFRNAEKVARREKEREKKDRESDSSNPPLTKDEMAILGGAFDFSQKTVAQVMTTLDDVFMLEASLALNFEVLLLIFQSGHSRVPVYDKTRDNIIGVLFAKDLILLDPEDSVPIKTVLLFFNRTVLLVFFDTTLNKMLNIFKQGGGHMAIIQQKGVHKPGEDPAPDTLGVVTLEDLIEELIGQDIVDETDVYTDNISKKRVKRVRSIDPEVLKMFDSKHHEELLSDKEVLVVASYLSNNTEEFSEGLVKLNVLKEMLAELPIVEYQDDNNNKARSNQHGLAGLASLNNNNADEDSESFSSDDSEDDSQGNMASSSRQESAVAGGMLKSPEGPQIRGAADPGSKSQAPNYTVYTRGVPTKNAVLIINGKLEISAGNDGFISDAGPWTLLGISALTDDLYAPDFTARVTEYPTRLLRIPRKLYRLMVRYSGTAESSRAGKSSVSPLTLEPASGKRRISEASERNRSSSSLALAAAAAAVAVGNPRKLDGEPLMPGTASDASIVKKTRTRPNGQSIEWSEMEPLGLAGEVKVGGSVTAEARPGRPPAMKPLTSKQRIDIVKPMPGRAEDKPPSQPPKPSDDVGVA